MNNSPGWASPGSTPSDEPARGTQEQPAQADPTGPAGQSSPPNWSKEQPPAGQWSAPAGIPAQSGPHGRPDQGTPGDRTRATAPGYGGPGGWGGAPGPGTQPPWGGAWAPTPQAAKPGVIPLRPLAVGEILDGAVATMRAHWRTVLGISLIVAVVAQTAVTVVTGLWFQDAGREPALSRENLPPLRESMEQLGNSLATTGITSVIGLLATLIATGLLTMVVSRAVLGRSVTAGEAWRDARPQLPRLLGLLVLLPLLLTAILAIGVAPGVLLIASGSAKAGLLLTLFGGLAAAVVTLWLWVRYSLASPALMLEKQGVITALRRSAKLVRGAWWRVLGTQLLTYLLIGIVEFIIQIPATLVAFLVGGESLMDWANGTSSTTGWSFLIALGVGAVISSTITFPISAGITALLYMDQRIRREALDLELARAAGLPGYGADVPTAHPAAPAPAASTPATGPAEGYAPAAAAPTATDTPADSASAGSPATNNAATDGSETSGAGTETTEPGTTPTATKDAPAKNTPAEGPGQAPDNATPGS
ncbi:hypothetical protein NCG97_23365 [Streptomyces lydicamycinicus]|uniref:DUF7544 domain-containing protein n=1 Tax=Streptomyces lydicamycinicus TaxID=1546107 RepID=UPI00203570A1|nr:hypothetical protein [Streptomyces lydicamycinicus]USA02918.1 hypothetical protein NCG97_23365 [Streptomyces lydicamycinicus]